MKNQLADRQRTEEIYHDEAHKAGVIQRGHLNAGNSSYYKLFYDMIGTVKGLKILEIGCGSGWFGMQLAREGASVLGIDISGELVKEATREAEKQGCAGRVVFQKMAVENLSFKNNHFDLIIGSAILHHTDIGLAIANIYRVLSPEGRAIFVEPLNGNIALKIWRKLTPWRRSPTERALLNRDIDYIETVFPHAVLNYFGLTSMVSMGLLMYFPESRLLMSLNTILEKFDAAILRIFPFWGRYYAVVVMELKKIVKN